jgi:hypothetical protein
MYKYYRENKDWRDIYLNGKSCYLGGRQQTFCQILIFHITYLYTGEVLKMNTKSFYKGI